MLNSGLKLLLVVFLLVVIFVSACFLFIGPIATFSINHFTDYSLAYQKWAGSPFETSRIDDMLIGVKDKGIGARAKEANFKLDLTKLIDERKLSIDCDFTGVSFVTVGSVSEDPASLANMLASGDVFSIPFSSNQLYGDVSFTLILDAKTLTVTGFNATSKDVKVTGDYVFNRDKESVSVDVKISVSPELSAMINEDVRNNILSPDEGGWYSAVINFKGNPLLLKALYSLAQ